MGEGDESAKLLCSFCSGPERSPDARPAFDADQSVGYRPPGRSGRDASGANTEEASSYCLTEREIGGARQGQRRANSVTTLRKRASAC